MTTITPFSSRPVIPGPGAVISTTGVGQLDPTALQKFLSVHKEITKEVLQGRAVSIGNSNDIDWTVAHGELIITWTTPDGLTVQTRQRLTKHGGRWRHIWPYVYAVAALGAFLVVVWNGELLLELTAKLLSYLS